MKNERPNKGFQGRMPVNSESFKVQVALEYLANNYSCSQIAEKYNLSAKTVSWFVSWYRKKQSDCMIEEPSEQQDPVLGTSQDQELHKKLTMAEMKIAVLEKVIAIANEEYRTDLKKKSCYQVIAELKGTRKHYSIDNLCAAFGYTRQAWYNHLKRTEIQHFQHHLVLQRIREIRTLLPKTGCVKLHKELSNGFLKSLGISMGRDAIFDLVRDNQMLIKNKKKWVRTTDSFHRYRIHPDLFSEDPPLELKRFGLAILLIYVPKMALPFFH